MRSVVAPEVGAAGGTSSCIPDPRNPGGANTSIDESIAEIVSANKVQKTARYNTEFGIDVCELIRPLRSRHLPGDVGLD